MDELNYNYLNEANLKIFLRKMGHHTVRKELVAILRRLDLDGDSKISFNEFVEGIKPVSPEIIPKGPQREQSIHSSPLKQMKKEEAERTISPTKQKSSHKKKRPHSADRTASKRK
jgi:Ca2+-binding EF-hand superfamily protein